MENKVPDEKSALTQQQLYEFDLTGYLIIRGFLNREKVEEMNRVIDDHQSGKPPPRKFTFLDLSPAFLDVMADPRVLAICELLLGKWFRLDQAFGIQDMCAAEKNSEMAEDLHAGPYANQGAFRYHWFNNRPQCGLVVFDYFLEPVNAGDGGLVIVRGSHKSNLPLEGRDVFAMIRKDLNMAWIDNPAMDAGDLLVFTEALIHGSKRWKPHERRRRNIHFNYSPGYQAQLDFDIQSQYLHLARNAVEQKLLRPPYVLRRDEIGGSLGKNRWRSPVAQD